jgi:hypothetical protein
MGGFSPQFSPSEYPTRVETISPPNPRSITKTDYPMADAERGTFQALALMASCVRGECEPDYSGFEDEFNCRVASEIVNQRSKSQRDQIAALYFFVRDNIVYLDHPIGNQVVQDCRRTIELGSGDCVSKSVCLATLLACLEIQSKFVAQHPSDNQAYSHVYVETLDGLALDSIADGKENRPFYQPGYRQKLPDLGFETSWNIFY